MTNTLDQMTTTVVTSPESEPTTISVSALKHDATVQNQHPIETEQSREATTLPTVAPTETLPTTVGPGGLSALNAEEKARLAEQENIIEKAMDGFREMGAALAAICRGGLFRATHHTFAEYVTARFGFSRQRAYQLMAASEYHSTLASQNSNILKLTSERATRELMKVPNDRVAEVLEEVIEGGEPTAERIIEAREKIVPKVQKKNSKAKKKVIAVKSAIKAAETWSTFLTDCTLTELPKDQRKDLVTATKNAVSVLKKLAPAA
ncbi:hypothetical protein [Brevifollis gellanilyticus]|uniref:DUF3102 domain-containing protein n=1 Tax=Brevifollis gellanilyticus TaxID=748831 RepID=A0A512M8N0_9BACT|nr:hypothetical protein [Brevifollis gellanilyticus]GEP43075.1 hypothetical protein BGE01nite_23660 [Brevifollis gellanilyticus]